MTGRAAGYCAGYGAPGYANGMPGMGRGRGGMGRGMGRRRGWGPPVAPYGPAAPMPPAPPAYAPYPQPTAEQELAALKQQAEAMRQGLDDIQSRITNLEKDAPTDP